MHPVVAATIGGFCGAFLALFISGIAFSIMLARIAECH